MRQPDEMAAARDDAAAWRSGGARNARQPGVAAARSRVAAWSGVADRAATPGLWAAARAAAWSGANRLGGDFHYIA
jgi:hypothetical protein